MTCHMSPLPQHQNAAQKRICSPPTEPPKRPWHQLPNCRLFRLSICFCEKTTLNKVKIIEKTYPSDPRHKVDPTKYVIKTFRCKKRIIHEPNSFNLCITDATPELSLSIRNCQPQTDAKIGPNALISLGLRISRLKKFHRFFWLIFL